MIPWHSSEELHSADPTTLSDEQKVAVIIDVIDQGRIDFHGGYPSDYVIEGRKLYWATLDAGKEYNAPQLVVRNIDEFIEDYDWVFEDRDGSLA